MEESSHCDRTVRTELERPATLLYTPVRSVGAQNLARSREESNAIAFLKIYAYTGTLNTAHMHTHLYKNSTLSGGTVDDAAEKDQLTIQSIAIAR